MINFRSRLQKAIPRGGFARNVLTLMTGTTISQGITILSSPILSRIYSPADFGSYTLFISISGILATIASGRYELAIMLPKEDEDSINLVILCILLAIGTSLIFFGIFGFFQPEFSRLFVEHDISSWVYLIPIHVFNVSNYQALNYWANRKSQYRLLANSRILLCVIILLVSIILGFTEFKSLGLIIGLLMGQFLTTSFLGFQIYRDVQEKLKYVTPQKIRELTLRYLDFPKHLTLSNLIGVVHLQIPIIVISQLFGTAALGFFAMANRIIALPTLLIAQAIGDVFRQQATEYYQQDGKFELIFRKTIQKTFLLALPIYTVLFFLSPYLFTWIFGEEWRTAGEYASILSILSFFAFVITPIDKGAVIVGATRYIFLWHFSLLIVNSILGFICGFFHLSIILFIWGFTLTKIAFYLLDFYIELKFSQGEKILSSSSLP